MKSHLHDAVVAGALVGAFLSVLPATSLALVGAEDPCPNDVCTTVSSGSVAEIEQKIRDLMSQVKALQAQLITIRFASTSMSDLRGDYASTTKDFKDTDHVRCIPPMVALIRGMNGMHVTRLQKFLVSEGLLPGTNGIFGSTTEAALKEWQAKAGVISSGDASTTGWGALGPKTIARMKEWCGVPFNEGRFRGHEAHPRAILTPASTSPVVPPPEHMDSKRDVHEGAYSGPNRELATALAGVEAALQALKAQYESTPGSTSF